MTDKQCFHLSTSATRISNEGSLSHLKSHFLWVCSTFSGKQINKCDSVMCPKCCEMWNTGRFSLKITSKSTPGPRMIKILKKDPRKLTRVESSLLKRHQKNVKNKLVLVCLVCKNETSIPFQRPTLEKTPKCATPIAECSIVMSTKKKKKKDRFAGLNASAVMSATPTPISSNRKNILDIRDGTLSSASPVNDSKINSPKNSTAFRTNMTPLTSKVLLSETNKKNGQKPVWKKMQSLRDEIRLEERNKIKDHHKALTIRNLNVKKNSKLQNFISRKEKDVHLEDRINCLLQI